MRWLKLRGRKTGFAQHCIISSFLFNPAFKKNICFCDQLIHKDEGMVC